jgi:uncharacterized membrane protein YtjA (UPF0391 family)
MDRRGSSESATLIHTSEPSATLRPKTKGGITMLSWAFLFLILALIAGALGMSGIAAVSSEIAWILFVVFMILFVVSLVFGRPRRAPPL